MRPSARARERLRLALDQDGWTQRELAKRVGKSQPWLQKILTGENALRLDDIDTVARALSIPPAELIRESGNELIEVSPAETQLLRSYRALAPEIRQHFQGVLQSAAHNVQMSDRGRHQKTVRSATRIQAETRPVVDDRSLSPSDQEFRRRLTLIVDALADLVSGKDSGSEVLAPVREKP